MLFKWEMLTDMKFLNSGSILLFYVYILFSHCFNFEYKIFFSSFRLLPWAVFFFLFRLRSTGWLKLLATDCKFDARGRNEAEEKASQGFGGGV